MTSPIGLSAHEKVSRPDTTSANIFVVDDAVVITPVRKQFLRIP